MVPISGPFLSPLSRSARPALGHLSALPLSGRPTNRPIAL
jgi:hypothetical protein